MIEDLSCVVVHHNSPSTLELTISSLISHGVNPEKMLVVDNSSSTQVAPESILKGASLLRMENRGYAAAVNAGVREMARRGRLSKYVLVSTHECQVVDGDLEGFIAAIRAMPNVGVAGPALVVRENEDFVWSLGGQDSRFLGLPGHRGHGDLFDAGSLPYAIKADWLDGAFCVYQSRIFDTRELDENYFVYFEENDFHHELSSSGYDVVCLPRLVVAQSSGGIPDFYLGRNARLMFRKRRGKVLGELITAFIVGRRAARILVKRSGSISDLRRGWVNGAA